MQVSNEYFFLQQGLPSTSVWRSLGASHEYYAAPLLIG
jgi:hypothetical protein